MSWMFGFYRALDQATAFEARLRGWLDAERRRHEGRCTTWETVQAGRATLCKASVGAYADAGLLVDPDGFAAVAGKALFERALDREAGDERGAELSLFRSVRDASAQRSVLRGSRGSYAIVDYESSSQTLLLATDRLGVRSVFIAPVPEGVLFSTSMTSLRQCGLLTHDVDLQGFAERLHLGYCLDDRTELKGINVLRGGEALRLTPAAVTREQYYDLLDFAKSREPMPFDPGRVYRAFIDAIRIRVRGEDCAVASLSGGLDSRSVCAGLRELGIDLTTISYGAPASQDQHFSKLMADRLGTRHIEVPQVHRTPTDSHSTETVLRALIERVEVPGRGRQRMIWNGDGGSVGLGFVYLSAEAAQVCEREGRLLPGMLKVQPGSAYLGGFRSATQTSIERLFTKGLAEEESRLAGLPPLAGLYMFLMRNDQRRHLHRHFDSILETGIDVQLPFFDVQLIETILSQPLEQFLAHQGYMDFLRQFSAPVLEVPWQAYPGHVQCHLPVPQALTYQWGKQKNPYLMRQWRRESINGFWQAIRAYGAIRSEVRIGPLLLGLARQIVARNRDYSYVVRGPSMLADIRTNGAA